MYLAHTRKPRTSNSIGSTKVRCDLSSCFSRSPRFLFPHRIGHANDWNILPVTVNGSTVKHGGRSVETFIAYPESKQKTPVILVIHEIFGLTDWAQEVADEFAEAGYIAVAPDLLSGMGANGGRTSEFFPK